MKRIIYSLFILSVAIQFSFGQDSNQNLILTNPNGYPYGFNINLNYTNTWAREYSLSHNGSGKLFSIGAYGDGNQLIYGYIGGNSTAVSPYSNPWMVFKPNGNVGIGTTSPKASGIGTTLHLSTKGDTWPFFRLERVDGKEKTNRAWESFIGSNGSYYLRDATAVTDPFIIQIGAPTNSLNITGKGYVGLGTSSPSNKLSVNGSMDSKKIFIKDPNAYLFFSSTAASPGNKNWYCAAGSDGSFVINMANDKYQWSKSAIKIFRNGNVIVHNTLEAKEIKVVAQPGADFVFTNNYNLRSLEEVETFVKENKHLPEVAPAKEMESEGVLQSEMNQTLLQKVEELTLYMIEMNKRVKTLESENKELKEKLSKQK